MRIERMTIKNFRVFRDVTIERIPPLRFLWEQMGAESRRFLMCSDFCVMFCNTMLLWRFLGAVG